MAVSHFPPEKFLACLYSFNVDGVDDFVEVTEHASCIEALTLSRSWVRDRHDNRKSEVWVGDYQVFDAEHVVHFDSSLQHRAKFAPVAPGRYGYRWTDDGEDYSFVLIKRGLGQSPQES